jgi:hypothetical protein
LVLANFWLMRSSCIWAIYNGPDECRDGIDSAEALIQGTIHRSISPAGAAKVRRRPHITHP